MILRRIMEHVRQQHWTAIWIDLAIVILGVFIGTQVSNWNAERETGHKAAVFTNRLKEDLRKEAWGYQYLIEYNRDVLAISETTANALTGKSELSNKELLINAYRATQYKQPQRFRATYDELISTGNIGLIKDPHLRLVAMQIYNVATMDNVVREGYQSRYREAFRMTIDNKVQRALNKQCGDRFVKRGDYKAIYDVIDYPCTLILPQGDIDQSAQLLRSNPLFVSYLRVRIADIDTRLVDMTVNNREIMQGLNALAKEKP